MEIKSINKKLWPNVGGKALSVPCLYSMKDDENDY
jgi:hypothetical protein